MMTFLRVAASRIRGHLRPGDLARDFDEELAAHLAMAEEDKVRQGMAPEEAHRMARVELGGLTQLREAGREARGLPWLDAYCLDVKLGLRMLRKSWGLTLVGGLAMTIAIGIGVVAFALTELAFGGKLPLEDGDRVIALQTWDVKGHRRHDTAMADLERWRDRLRSVEDVGAFQNVERRLLFTDGLSAEDGGESHGPGEPVTIAEMTASGFELARVPPLLGRPLTPEDEREGASPVVVIGFDVWQSRFGADPEVLGRSLRLGDTAHTVVGVMPEGFAFPVNHRFWIPLRADRSGHLRDRGPFGVVFGRLAPGVTLEGTQAELATLGLLPPAEPPEADEDLHPRAVPYSFAFTGDFERGEIRWVIRVMLLVITLLLVPPCANVAILVYARTVARQEELAARYVLGASRARIVAQLFIEMLVLAAGSAGVALVIARLALGRLEATTSRSLSDGAPFWMSFDLSLSTLLFAAGLAVVAALIAGAVPALKATGGQMQSGLRTLGGHTRTKLGPAWTALVVTQIALSLAVLPSAVEMGWGTVRNSVLGPGFAAEEYLTARLTIDRESLEGTAAGARFGALQTEMIRQLEAEPGVSAVTVASAVPGEEPWADVEVDGVPLPEDGLFEGNNLVRFNRVDGAFFDTFDVPLLAGRGFEAGDFEPAGHAVIVNRTFARQLLGDDNPLGRRIRFLGKRGEETLTETEAWLEIVGVVADCPQNASRGTLYRPAARGLAEPASLALDVGSAHDRVADRLREVASALSPALRIEEVLPLDEIYRQQAVGNNVGASVLAAVTLSVLLLSAAGIYALMSFTVSQRRREIGIRSALGAAPHRLLAGVFRRALGQLAIGAGSGVLLALLLDRHLPVVEAGGWNVPGIVPAAALFMTLVGLLATTGPALRGLRVEPTEALREG